MPGGVRINSKIRIGNVVIRESPNSTLTFESKDGTKFMEIEKDQPKKDTKEKHNHPSKK